MRRTSRILLTIPITAVILLIILITIKLYYQPADVAAGHISEDMLRQMHFLKQQKLDHAAEDLQKIYPEGYVFFNALYGLAWNDLNTATNLFSLKSEAYQEIDRACESLLSVDAKSTFQEALSLPYGAFYTGWSNYVLGKSLMSEREHERAPEQLEIFKTNCEQIASVINSKESPYPVSYYEASWPADVMVCVASLALHDRMFDAEYQNSIELWLSKVKETLDSNGLIPHSTDPATGKPLEEARGSSQSLMLIFLNEIDPEFARAQFSLYKSKFLSSRFGLPAIREYPEGTSGNGDIDSGPVIFGIGAAASIVGIRTMHVFGEYSTSRNLRSSIEAFAFPVSTTETKRYLFGQVPIADAFIAWVDAGCNTPITTSNDKSWRNMFHLYSAGLTLLLLLFLTAIWFFWPKPKPKQLFIDW